MNTTRPAPVRRRWLRNALAIAFTALLLYCGLIGVMLWNQERLLFYPVKLAPDFQFNKPDVVERTINVPGATLSALHFRQPNSRGLIFFLHGNAGNLDIWLPSTEFYRRAGFDVFMMDYRGFGKSTGHIESEAQLHADVKAAWHTVAREYADKPIVIYGRSLGSGLALKLASEVAADEVIIVSPYESFVQLARDHFPWVPSAATRYTMRSDEWIKHVQAPIYMVHGGQDTLIKPYHAEHLLALHPEARLLMIPTAGHNDIHSFAAYQDALAKRLKDVTERRHTPQNATVSDQ